MDRTELRLKSISLAGIKGAGADPISFAPITLFHGGNTSGKSRIATAIELAVLGYASGIPKTPDGVMRLATEHDIDVNATFLPVRGGEDLHIQRTWRRREITRGQKAGQIKVDGGCRTSWAQGSNTTTAHERSIRDLFGDEVLYDLSRLLDLSDAKRRQVLFELGGQQVRDAWSTARVREELPSELRAMVDQWRPDQEAILEWVYRVTAENHELALELRRQAFEQRAAERALRETVQSPDPAVIGQLRQQIEDEERAERARATERGQALKAAQEAIDQARRQNALIGQAQEALVRAQQELARLQAATPAAPDVQALQARLQSLEGGSIWPAMPGLQTLRGMAEAARVQTMVPPDQSALYRAREALQGKQREIDAAREAQGEYEVAAQTAKATFTMVEKAVRAAESRLAMLRVGTGWGVIHCPTCGQIAGAEVLGAIEAEVTTHQTEVAQASQQASDAMAAARQKQAEVTRLRNEVPALERACQMAQQQIDAACTEVRRAYQQADDAVRDRLAAIDDARAALEAATRERPADPRIATLTERIRGLSAQASQPQQDQGVLTAAAERARQAISQAEAAFAEKMAGSRAELNDGIKKLRDLEQAERHKANALEIEERQKIIEGIRNAFGPDGLMGKIVEEALGPFISAVNNTLEGLRLGAFTVRLVDERGNPVFHLGVERPRSKTARDMAKAEAAALAAEAERLKTDAAAAAAEAARRRAARKTDFHNIETISGGEKSATLAGISVGLATIARSPWRVALVDEIQDMDIRRRRAFLRKVVDLVAAGSLDQAILFGCPDRIESIDGVEAIDLGDGGWK